MTLIAFSAWAKPYTTRQTDTWPDLATASRIYSDNLDGLADVARVKCPVYNR
jgi:hypothetical protein